MTCTQDGCSADVLYRGLCRNHYVRENAVAGVAGNRAICTECDRVVEGHGLCRVHLRRLRRTGQLELRERPTVCVVQGCERPPRRNSMCSMHADRVRRHGSPDTIQIGGTFDQRLARKVTITGCCWYWTGTKTHDGYGRLRVDKADLYAHRWVYENLVGSIPADHQLDHLCFNRPCVNPDHLEPVSPAQNVQRMNDLRTKGRP